jgi:hypothetical protein
MKILILSNCNNYNPIEISDCKTRTEMFLFLIKQYFDNIGDTELTFKKCYPHLNTQQLNNKLHNYPKSFDHIMFVNSRGFYDTHISFYDKLRELAKYSVSSFCDCIKFSLYEDITFTMDKCTYHKKLSTILPPLDPNLYIPNKSKTELYVLLHRQPLLVNIYNTDIPYILKQIETLIEKGTEVKIGLIDQKSIDFINTNGDIQNSQNFNSYIDFIQEIAKANLFFITHKFTDKFALYEIAMCNTLMISKTNFIDKYLVDELLIYTYSFVNKNFTWSDILDRESMYSMRSLLTNDNTWTNVSNTIIDTLREFEIIQVPRELITKPQINTINKVLNINNKHKPKITKILSMQPTAPKIIPKKKKLRFLQSRILSNTHQ